MSKRVAVLALSLAVAGCATTTPQTAAAENQVCDDVASESTGSRVQTERVCRPAQ
jgi:hypothetical protein